MAGGKYGKDDPGRFISGALSGGGGASNEIENVSCDRPGQTIKRAYALDNVGQVYSVPNGAGETSLKDKGGFAGSETNLGHSLTGASAVADEVGAAGKVKHVLIPNH